MMKYFSLAIPLVALALAVLLLQSRSREDYLLEGAGQEQEGLRQLFRLLDQEKEPGAGRFTLLQQISGVLKQSGDLSRINLFLTSYVASNPQDPFNAQYLHQVGENYRQLGAPRFAVRYYERVLKNHPDLLVKGESVHFLCLSRLIAMEENPALRLGHFQELLARFPDRITSAQTYYFLGKNYEALGEWEQAMNSYSAFLAFPEPAAIGDPKAFQRVRTLVDFYNSDKKWARPDLETIVHGLKSAVREGSVTGMENLRAKVNFFALSWDYKDIPSENAESFDTRTFLRDFLNQSRTAWGTTTIEFDDELASDSNESEAYIRTTGWNYRLPTWYFYFRKINFPPNAEINGEWEWAGIYFGEKL